MIVRGVLVSIMWLHAFNAVVRIVYGDESESVAIVNGGCMHLLVVARVRVVYGDDSECVDIVDGGCMHLFCSGKSNVLR